MDAATYNAWYETPRGRWIGATEFRLLSRRLRLQTGETLLDVGCGTGWFTRRFAHAGALVTGIDANPDSLTFARRQGPASIRWIMGDARNLPFGDRSFDRAVSVAALCFVDDEQRAVAEMVRVTRQRFAIGWLNRTSLLHHHKGQGAGSGAYQGARWHDSRELLDFFSGLPVRRLAVHSAVFLPSGNGIARSTERLLPYRLRAGGFVVVSGEIHPARAHETRRPPEVR
ncbi:MAG: class I SAM-dependent methyltransferase [Acidiferrobacter sp.]